VDHKVESLNKHREWGGKIETVPKMSLSSKAELSIAYTPGVAYPCIEIQKNPSLSFELTGRHNTVAVVTDGTAVLGLGDVGPEAAMPVMEGKCVLFKTFGGVDAVPLCIRSKNVDEIVNTIALLAGSFGGINLEDISAPRCFEIERKLKERCDIPIFHDDQHGTAVVTLAAMINALKIVNKDIQSVRVVINGAGAAGIAIVKLMQAVGLDEVILCDTLGAIYRGRDGLNPEKIEIAEITNKQQKKGALSDVIKSADVFIGVSAQDTVTQDMVRSMAANAILFPLANPIPEIMPDLALEAGAAIVGTGRSDFNNQINNVLAFPGIFRGALDVRAREINTEMLISAARALAGVIPDNELTPEYIIPEPFDKRVKDVVSSAVKAAAIASGAAGERA
jgi:malate dehydrogenase (oxaloacetate-decarboxylating)